MQHIVIINERKECLKVLIENNKLKKYYKINKIKKKNYI